MRLLVVRAFHGLSRVIAGLVLLGGVRGGVLSLGLAVLGLNLLVLLCTLGV